jgi:imidazole glycerol-phosphate synthase subunit HisF
MFKKRIIPIVLIKENIVVQSIKFNKYLPIGKPEAVIENLDRWGADEIIVLDITAANRKSREPNFQLLRKIGSMGIGTPLAYGGGVNNVSQAKEIIQIGFERVSLTHSFFYENRKKYLLESIAKTIGAQAIVLSLPIKNINKKFYQYNYTNKKIDEINFSSLIENKDLFSELLLMDTDGEGVDGGFDEKIYNLFEKKIKNNLLLFGGLNQNLQVLKYLKKKNVMGVGIGNFLNYKEHAIQCIKEFLIKQKFKMIRSQEYKKNII